MGELNEYLITKKTSRILHGRQLHISKRQTFRGKCRPAKIQTGTRSI